MPADYQVARPVAAPNYPGMYSEAIKGALEPMNYLLNMQKELSEEDYRKGEIQNFLDEHQDKANQLAETTRSNKATEAMTLLERNLEAQRQAEIGRHDLVDEAHQDRADTELERAHKRDEDLRAQTESEVERAHKAEEDQRAKDLDLRTTAQQYDIESKQAESRRARLEGDLMTRKMQEQQQDDDTIDKLNIFLKDYTPNQIYGSNDNPELQAAIDEARRNTHTSEARQRLDEIIGSKTAIGRENEERIELNHMSTEAKDAFQSNMLRSAPSGMPGETGTPTQQRFEDALTVARNVQTRFEERSKWGDAGITAYKTAKADGKDDITAQGIGRMADFSAVTAAKTKADDKPDASMVKTIVEHLRGPKQKDDKGNEEDDETWKAREDAANLPKAIKMERAQRLGTTQDVTTGAEDLTKPPPAKSADEFTKRLLPQKPAGSSNYGAGTDQTDNKGKAADTPVGGSTSAAPAARSLLPMATPNYTGATDEGDLFASMRNIFGAPFNPAAQPGDETTATA